MFCIEAQLPGRQPLAQDTSAEASHKRFWIVLHYQWSRGWLESKSGSVCAGNAIEIYGWSRRTTTFPFSKKRAMARCLPSGDQAKEPILWEVLLDR